jgi:hypothetical protein
MSSGIAIDGVKGLTIQKDSNLFASRMERLFFTPIGESIGNLERGSRIPDFFWEGATEENAQAILREVKFLLQAFEKEIIPSKIFVKFVTPDSINGNGWSNTALVIIIEYCLNSTALYNNILFFYYI